jgi:uroporphyrinogen decarboxylase
MFSPQVMHKLFYPYLEELCHVLAEAGIKTVFHTDGYVMDIADDLVACGIAGLNPLEPLAGNDIPELKRRYGDRLILVGGIDCSQTLPLGSVDDVRAAVRDLLDTCGRGGGLFIGSSSEIVPATPVENIHAFYDACREFGRYPLAF